MRTEREIRDKIRELEKDYAHVLKGRLATIQANAPVALIQTSAESMLSVLHWVLDKQYKSKLKGQEGG